MATDEETKKRALKFYEHFREHFINNPDFERCIKERVITGERKYEPCKLCEYYESCEKGEQIWVENENIIEELIDFVMKLSKKEGIQMERQRLRRQVNKDKQEVDYDTHGSHHIIETKNIDIWDDVK